MKTKKLVLSAIAAASCLIFANGAIGTTTITGAGSSFVYPVLSQWAQTYNKETGIQINYQPIGSGGGLTQLGAKTVNFAASDAPQDIATLNSKGYIQFPVIVGGIVLIVNISGIAPDQLVLDGKTLGDIYLGKITKWNDPSITKLNPDTKLPDKKIVLTRRADGSGTTFNFTNYLSKVNPDWKSKVGSSTDVQWQGMTIGAKGNAGVATQVKTIPNTIGYVEYAYAKQNKLTTVKMVNNAGEIVSANADTFKEAAANAVWDPANGFNLVLTDAPGKNSWPIDASTFVLMYKDSLSKDEGKAIIKFFSWVFAKGQDQAKALDYVPIPDNVVKMVEDNWK